MLFSCTSRTENRMSAQMIPAAFPGLDYDNVFVWKITQAEVGLKGTKLWVWLQISELPVRGKNVCVACLGSPRDPGHQYLSTEQGAPRHVPHGQPASCPQGLLSWGRAALGLPSPSTASTSQLVCTAVLLPGASLWLLSNRCLELQQGNVPRPFPKMWFNLNCSTGCSLLNTQGRLSLLRYLFTKDD